MKIKSVHPVAELFPTMEKEDPAFVGLCQSITEHGQLEPIVVDDDVLLDGRNRLAACEALGLRPKFVQWGTLGIRMDQAEWIFARNAARRHLTEDQRLMVCRQFIEWREADAKDRKAASQFPTGKSGNPGGRKKPQVNLNSGSPERSRNSKDLHDRSTAGKLASMAKTSRHKAEQAIKVDKAVKAGDLPEDTPERVLRGETTLAKEAAKIKPPKAESDLRSKVEAKFRRFMDGFAVADHSSVKGILWELLS